MNYLTSEPRILNEEEIVSPINDIRKLDTHVQKKMKLNLYLTMLTDIKLKWIKDL